MERMDYDISVRDALFANLAAAGKIVVEDVTIDLDGNGRLTTCYCIVTNAEEAGKP